jgi:hypothetical protein
MQPRRQPSSSAIGDSGQLTSAQPLPTSAVSSYSYLTLGVLGLVPHQKLWAGDDDHWNKMQCLPSFKNTNITPVSVVAQVPQHSCVAGADLLHVLTMTMFAAAPCFPAAP